MGHVILAVLVSSLSACGVRSHDRSGSAPADARAGVDAGRTLLDAAAGSDGHRADAGLCGEYCACMEINCSETLGDCLARCAGLPPDRVSCLTGYCDRADLEQHCFAASGLTCHCRDPNENCDCVGHCRGCGLPDDELCPIGQSCITGCCMDCTI